MKRALIIIVFFSGYAFGQSPVSMDSLKNMGLKIETYFDTHCLIPSKKLSRNLNYTFNAPEIVFKYLETTQDAKLVYQYTDTIDHRERLQYFHLNITDTCHFLSYFDEMCDTTIVTIHPNGIKDVYKGIMTKYHVPHCVQGLPNNFFPIIITGQRERDKKGVTRIIKGVGTSMMVDQPNDMFDFTNSKEVNDDCN